MSDIVKISYNEYNDGDILPSSKINELQKCIQSHEAVIDNSITLDNIKAGSNIKIDKNDDGLIINNTQNVILDFPDGLVLNGTMEELINSLDEKNVESGHIYFGGVLCSDLPENMIQAELKIEIAKNSDDLNVYYFTIISTEVSPYMWTGTGYQGEFSGWQARTYNEELKKYVKFTDIATDKRTGVVSVNSDYGIGIGGESNDTLVLQYAVNNTITNRNGEYNPITPTTLNFAVKSALTDEKRISDMTEDEKKNARSVIGAKTPYEIVKENGYTKTEIEFNKDLAAIEGLADWFANL